MSSTDVSSRDRVLAELADLGPGTGDAVSLLIQVRQLATFADQVQGELARLTGLADRSGAYAEAGYSSAAAFLRHGCGRSFVRAGELVAVGRAFGRLDATPWALIGGRLSFDAAHVICRATSQISDQDAAAAAEQEMLTAATAGLPGSRSAAEAASKLTGSAAGDPPLCGAGANGAQPADADTGHTAGTPSDLPAGQTATSQADAGQGTADRSDGGWAMPGLDPRELRRLGEDLTYRADPDAVEERQRKRFERRYLSFGVTLDEVGTISGACSDALSLEIIRTAAEAFSPPGGAADTRTPAQRRMDGLTAACQAALDSGRAGSRHGALPHLTVLLEQQTRPDAPTEPADPGARAPGPVPGPARTEHGAMLTARQVLTLACRAEISVIRWRDGLPLDVGRRYRTETPALRRALAARDRGCRFPGCGLPATWCTAHHIRHWKRGGATRLPNMVLLCFVHHHYFIHLLGWTLTGTADALLRFTHPGGWLTLDSPLPAQPVSRSP